MDSLQESIDSLEVKHIELIKENRELKHTIKKQHDKPAGSTQKSKRSTKEKFDKLTKRRKDLEDQLQKSINSNVKTADCDTGDILLMKEEIEMNRKEIVKLKKALEDKVLKVTQQTDSFTKKQIYDLKESVKIN